MFEQVFVLPLSLMRSSHAFPISSPRVTSIVNTTYCGVCGEE